MLESLRYASTDKHTNSDTRELINFVYIYESQKIIRISVEYILTKENLNAFICSCVYMAINNY